MGMAASQARFLSLTARKSNVEYEGQQVNQQRTALANESANLYNRLTSIKVPTPPSTSDYYETVYTFTTSELDNSSPSGSTEYTLENIFTSPDGMYAHLAYPAYQWEPAVTSAYSGNINKTTNDNGNTTYSVTLQNGTIVNATEYTYQPAESVLNFNVEPGAQEVTLGGIDFSFDGKKISSNSPKESYAVTENADGSYSVKVRIEKTADNNDYTYKFGGKEYPVTKEANGTYSCEVPEDTYFEDINGKYVDAAGRANSGASYFDKGFLAIDKMQNQPILAYTLGSQTYFISASEFDLGIFQSSSYVHNVSHTEYVDYPCEYATAPSGRYQTLYITDEKGDRHEFSLKVTNVEDEERYRQAMLDYEYDQARYQKEVADINAKTESLQQEDRTLELRLKQLDTEQNAIKTEMEAVSKVIENNIESTFKTFA